MAKLSIIMRNKKRIKRVEVARKTRLEAREQIKKGDLEEQELAILKLQKRSPNESLVRVRNRCHYCGRPRGVLRKFGLCRIHLREAVMRGDVPGVKKASW